MPNTTNQNEVTDTHQQSMRWKTQTQIVMKVRNENDPRITAHFHNMTRAKRSKKSLKM